MQVDIVTTKQPKGSISRWFKEQENEISKEYHSDLEAASAKANKAYRALKKHYEIKLMGFGDEKSS